MLLTLKLALRRALYLLRTRLDRKGFVVAPTSPSFKRAMLRTYRQRRSRGNVLLHLGKRRGRYHNVS